MLGKLNLSKILFLFFIATSCGKKQIITSTEIICPDGSRILVKFSELEEVRRAILNAHAEKKKYGTDDKHTIIKLPGNRSFRIEKIPPEEMIKCSVRESVIGQLDKKYLHKR